MAKKAEAVMIEAGGREVRVSSPDRVIFAATVIQFRRQRGGAYEA